MNGRHAGGLLFTCITLLPSVTLLPCIANAGEADRPEAVPSAARQTPAPAATLRVSFVEPLSPDDELAQVLRSWLEQGRAPAEFDAVPASALQDVLAGQGARTQMHIWLCMVNKATLRLYAVDPTTGRFLVRDISVPATLDELSRERIAQVVVALRDAFGERRISSTRMEVAQTVAQTMKQSRAAAEPSDYAGRAQERHAQQPTDIHVAAETKAVAAPTPAATAIKGTAQSYLEWSLGYQIRNAHPEPVAHGFEARIAFGVHSERSEYEVAILGRQSLERRLESDILQLSLGESVLAMAMATRWLVSAHWWWSVEGGPALFWQRFSPRAIVDGLVARPDSQLLQAGLTFATGPRLQATWGWAQLGLNLDWQPQAPSYEIGNGTQATTVWSARALELGAFVRCGTGKVPL
ncbi:MAG TPA: hypothetical protein VHM70_01550 [Polyangiaceae bacterium]|nr:hypothetical protein [Polyangiaceae bacterium]